MNARQAMKHFKKFGGFYLDAAGHRALYKLIKRQTKIIRQAKYATAEACTICENASPDAGTCRSCHVWKLVQMIRREAEHGRKTSD